MFHEPINIRAENVERIEAHAIELGVKLRTDVFSTREKWQDYAVESLASVHRIVTELGIEKHLHLWPDKSLGSQSLLSRVRAPGKFTKRLEHWWHRISEWPE